MDAVVVALVNNVTQSNQRDMKTIFVVITASSLSPLCKSSSRLFITLRRLSCVRKISCSALHHTNQPRSGSYRCNGFDSCYDPHQSLDTNASRFQFSKLPSYRNLTIDRKPPEREQQPFLQQSGVGWRKDEKARRLGSVFLFYSELWHNIFSGL